MNTSLHRSVKSAPGAVMMVVLMLTIVGGIAITGWISLVAARLIQAERSLDSATRRVIWDNSASINQQYGYAMTFRDNVTQPILFTTLSGNWGGISADLLAALDAFDSSNNFTNPSSAAYPFNNLRYTPTADGSVFYTRTTSSTDAAQVNRVLYYNFQKSYPRTLLGDIFIIHKKPASAPGSAYITDNFSVSGRAVIYDSTIDISGMDAVECLNMTRTGTNGTQNSTGSSAMLPLNYPATPVFQMGAGGQDGGAVIDGTLSMINNPSSTSASIWSDMQTDSLGYFTLSTAATSGPTLYSRGNLNSTTDGGVTGSTVSSPGTSSSDVWIQSMATPTYTPPAVGKSYYYAWASPLKTATLLLHSPTMRHIRVVSGVNQLVLQGQTNATDYTNAGNLPPLIVWVDQEVRDIRFVGENNRPLVLAVGTGTGLTCYFGFSGNGIATANTVRWRLNLINQYRDIWLDPAASKNYNITGSFRTDWSIHCTDNSATNRYFLSRETSPGALVTRLPRDAWMESLFVQ